VTAVALAGDGRVAFAGIMMVLAPVASKPTVPFGVRVPPERTGAPLIRVQRRAYCLRTAAVVACCSAGAFLLPGHAPWWQSRLILLAEVAGCLACLQLARRKIAAVKSEGQWFAGRRQAVVADTGWRTDPPRFPVGWLAPALAVIVATVMAGIFRYPDLPARLALSSGRLVPKSPASVFAPAIGQVYVTLVYAGVVLLICRARPDIEAADPAASAARYRAFLGRVMRAVLALAGCLNLTLMLSALRTWQVCRLSGAGAAIPLLPCAAGLAIVGVVAVRAGQGGFRLARDGHRPAGTAVTDRDDDRFWKAGILYVNRGDPALIVARRFGAGWTFNFANPVAWLLITSVAATSAGLTVILTVLRGG
jgi:uncharacterized membrane protein